MPDNKVKYIIKQITKIKIKKYLIVLNIIEPVLILLIIALFYLTIPLTSSKVIDIPRGSASKVLNYLSNAGYEINFIDNMTIRYLGYPQSGWINLGKTSMTKADFLYKLTTSKAAITRVTLVPGETYYFFLKILANKLHLNYYNLLQAYNMYKFKDDGNILANSYDLPIGMNARHLMFYLISYSNQKYKNFSQKIFGRYNKSSWYSYLSIASIIQKESAGVKEMPLVSSVIHNRLKKGMRLQMDGTLNYGKYSHTPISSKRIREDTSTYNTYKYRGIPDSPVCAVNFDAIKAAIFPIKSNYLYFVKNAKTKKHFFSKSFRKHKYNIRKNIKTKKSKKSNHKKHRRHSKNITSLWKSIK